MKIISRNSKWSFNICEILKNRLKWSFRNFENEKKKFLISKCKIVNFFVETSKMYFYWKLSTIKKNEIKSLNICITTANIENEKKRFVELSIDIIEKTCTKKFKRTLKFANVINLKIFVAKKKFCILFESRICGRK